MLRIINDEPRTWAVAPNDLRDLGLRAPQGFSLHLSLQKLSETKYWTTNEEAAFMLYKQLKNKISIYIEEFEEQIKFNKELYELSYALDSDIEFECPKGLEYRPWQKAGIDYVLRVKNCLIADEQRVGKSYVVLGAINQFPIEKVVIICPKTVKLVWEQYCKEWLIEDYKIQVLDTKSDFDNTANIYIINYDIVDRFPELYNTYFDVITFDEIHQITRPENQRSKWASSLKGGRIWGLSGTPLLNNPIDLLYVLQRLDDKWKKFFVRGTKFFSDSGVVLDLKEVQEQIRGSLLLRRKQAQTFKNEPIEIREIPLPVTDKVRPLIEAELNNLADYAKIRQALGLTKVTYAINHIDTYTSDGTKLVAFAYHKEVIDRVASSLGAKCEVIYGDTSDKERLRARTRFVEDPSCSVLLGSIGALSMGVDLSVSSHIVFIESDWSSALMSQALERCSDLLQMEPVLAEFLIYPNSLDTKMIAKVNSKYKNCDEALDIL